MSASVPPGPKGLPLIGNLESFDQDRLGFLLRCARDYGGVVRYSDRVYIVNDPDVVEKVLVNSNTDYLIPKNFLQENARPENAPDWMGMRAALAPHLHRRSVSRFAAEVGVITGSVVSSWRPGVEIDALREMETITSTAIAKYFFRDDYAEIPSLATELLDAIVVIIGSPFVFPPRLPTPTRIRIRKRFGRLERAVSERIAGRRRDPDRFDDAATWFWRSSLDRGSIGERQVTHTIIGNLLAAHRVPAAALAWLCYLLGRTPHAAERVRDEVSTVLGGRPLTEDDLPRLTYLDCVVKETLRLYPPTWHMQRVAVKETQVGAYSIKAGHIVMFSPYVIHRDPRWFEDPEAFVPERWLTRDERRIPKYAYLPFGGGPRVCPGANFAYMALMAASATMAQRGPLALADGANVRPNPRNTLTPIGLTMTAQDLARR